MKIIIIAAILLFLYSLSLLFYDGGIFTVYAQSGLQIIKYRNLVIDLGNGVKTNAQLTLPAVGKGPFPAVLLIHGSGRTDMNESLLNAKPFWQISHYLTERGFVVLRYDKRGIGANHIISDSNVWGNATFNELKQDAEKALAVLINQPEVDPNKITVLGHSEGTMIAPRVAIDNTTKVKNVVLMGTVAQNLGDIQYLQVVSIPLHYAEKVLDHNHDGMLSVAEANENPVFSGMVGNFTLLLETTNGTKHQLNPKYNTNKDAAISINNELKPKLVAQVESLPAITLGNKCTSTCPTWVRSHYALEPTLDIIGNVSPKTSILILQGENDTQTPVQQAFLLQQTLIDKRHPDHTLITYPNLGHLFYPSSEWKTAFGSIQQNVLADLYSWLAAHSGFTSPAASSTTSLSSSSSNSTTK